IKSFMVSHDGRVFERDLGPSSAARAAAIKSFRLGAGPGDAMTRGLPAVVDAVDGTDDWPN
ncbi:MAG: DUF2950 family protein, partial [Cupriavidus necator]